MSARKSERLLNLLITLLVARTYVTKDRLRQVIDDYRGGTDEAFEKMFERDKEDLREMGVPIELGSHDPLFDDEVGYRVRRSAFELPDVPLEADEAAVVGLAARVWQHAGLASATSDALVKLRAAGVETDREALDVVQPVIAADEPSFEAFWEAVLTRTPVAFDHRRSSSPDVTRRHLQPWGVVSFRGRWYVVGHDTDRGAERMFRLSRVQGAVEPDGEPGSFSVPAGTDLRALTERLGPPPAEVRTAALLVRPGAGHALRRRGTPVDEPAPEGWERLDVPFPYLDGMVEEVLGAVDAVVVLGPDDLRTTVVRRLALAAAEPARVGDEQQDGPVVAGSGSPEVAR